MDRVTLVEFILLVCSLGGPFGRGSLYLVGVFLESLVTVCYLRVGFPCWLGLDCAGDFLVVFCFCLGGGSFILWYGSA